MGFRNPITTAVDPVARSLANQALTDIIPGSRLAADAIDGMTITGAILQTAVPTSAGVRVYESTDGKGNPLGLIELYDGISGDTPAQIHAGNYAGGGGGLALSGGAYSGNATKTAASLVLQTDQANLSTAQLTAPDGFLLNGAPVATMGADWTYVVENNTYNAAVSASAFTILTGHSFTITPPAGVELEVEWKAPRITVSAGGEVSFRLVINGGIYDSCDFSSSAGSLWVPARMTGSVLAGGTAISVSVQGKVTTGSSNVQAVTPAGGYLMLRYVLR